MFWSVSDNLYNVDQMSSNMKANIEAAKKRNVQESDLALLDASYDHMCEDSVYFYNYKSVKIL